MNYIIDFIQEEDYETLCEWWSFWRFPSPPKEALPDNGLGGLKVSYMKDGEKIDVCAGFLYGTNSSIAWLEFIVSNPNVKDKKVRGESLNELIKEICSRAKTSGYGAIFSSLKNENLINKYTDVGFTKSNTKTTELTLNLSTWE